MHFPNPETETSHLHSNSTPGKHSFGSSTCPWAAQQVMTGVVFGLELAVCLPEAVKSETIRPGNSEIGSEGQTDC